MNTEARELKATLGERLARQAPVAAGLSLVALYSKVAHNPVPDYLPQPAYDSLAHPSLGYIGALSASMLADKFPRAHHWILLAGATTLNFATEFAQDIEKNTAHPFYEASQRAETAKDFAFALGGFALYSLRDAVLRRKTKSENSERTPTLATADQPD